MFYVFIDKLIKITTIHVHVLFKQPHPQGPDRNSLPKAFKLNKLKLENLPFFTLIMIQLFNTFLPLFHNLAFIKNVLHVPVSIEFGKQIIALPLKCLLVY